MSLPNEERKYTYRDYLSWPEDERIELVDGTVYMQAATSRIHQKVLSELHRQIANFLVGKGCDIYPAPFHVVLDLDQRVSDESDIQNVFEPDITIVCDKSKLDERGCKGTPDMVIEIVSLSTARRDKLDKFTKYEQAGVQEYWIVEPKEKILSVFTLQENQHFGRPNIYADKDEVPISIFDNVSIELGMVFSD